MKHFISIQANFSAIHSIHFFWLILIGIIKNRFTKVINEFLHPCKARLTRTINNGLTTITKRSGVPDSTFKSWNGNGKLKSEGSRSAGGNKKPKNFTSLQIPENCETSMREPKSWADQVALQQELWKQPTALASSLTAWKPSDTLEKSISAARS